MSTKLTLTLQKEVIEVAKAFAKEKGQSLSDLVENYFKLITNSSSLEKNYELSNKVKSLKGILKVDSNFDYKTILEEELLKKYGL